MSDFSYFLSYAREDRDEDNHDVICKFRTDLEQEVRMVRGSAGGRVGFYDGQDIKSGDNWADALSRALCTSRVFVPIYSPTYFNSDYCGREWRIFSDRLEAYRRQNPDAQVENLIQPVLLVPPGRTWDIPDHVSDIQYEHDQYPEDYRTVGLHVISRVGGYKDSYARYVNELARRIVEAAKEHPLPPLYPCLDIRETRSAFHQPGVEIPAVNDVFRTTGPRYVQFIFVAGRRDELQDIRESLESYGDEGGSDWKPFLPDADEVWQFAMGVAIKEKLFPEIVSLDKDVVEKLKEAERDHKIVVIVVDAWTLVLERYRTFMQSYDDLNFLNCVVLVLWNLDDNETLESRSALEHAIQSTFPKNWVYQHPCSFHDAINSPDELKSQLSVTLREVSARIIKSMEVAKRAEGPQVIFKPLIEGSGV